MTTTQQANHPDRRRKKPAPVPPPTPTPAPAPTPSPGPPGAPRRVVVLIQENKTTDFYFPTMGAWGADVSVHGTLLTSPPDYDQPHDRNSWVHYRMGDYAPPALQIDNDVVIPYYSWLAKTFTFCDHHVGLGSNSTPGHMFAMGGQTPTMKNPPMYGPATQWNLPSIFSHAQAHGVDWAAFPSDGNYPTKFYADLQSAEAAQHLKTPEEFVTMAKAGTLPSLVYVWSPNGYDEHPPLKSDPGYVTRGQELVWQRVQAVIDGGGWQDTVFILTWDDWGGYADSVATPSIETLPDALHPQGFQAVAGSRIPLIMFGGAVTQGIDPQWYTLASIPKTVIDLLGLPAFGVPRVDSAPSLAHRVDASLRRPVPPVPGAAITQPTPPTPAPAPVRPAPWPTAPQPMPPLVTLDGSSVPAPTDGVVRQSPPPPPKHNGAAQRTAVNAWSEGEHYGGSALGGSFVLPGSERSAYGQVVGPVADGDVVEVTLVLRRRTTLPAVTGETVLAPDEFARLHGADQEDLDRVQTVVRAAGLQVLEVDQASRRVRVGGPAGRLADFLGTSLERARVGDQEFRQRVGALHLPLSLEGVVVAVLGLDDRPQANMRAIVLEPRAVQKSYTPPELAQLYQMPDGDGSGQVIAIIELGGGFGDADLKTYFGQLGLTPPTVTAVGVDGAVNKPGGDPQGADGEVLLDIEVAGGIAPAAQILVYFAPNTDAGFLDAVAQATHATPTPTAISISWGQSEDQWTGQARSAMDAAFADAAALGITVTAAAGDDGSGDRDTSAPGVHADFPASSPHVLACGGTHLVASGHTVSSETVWQGSTHGATGGGVSDAFPLPVWQADAGVPSRASAQRQAAEQVPQGVSAEGDEQAVGSRKHHKKPSPPHPKPGPTPPVTGSGRGVPDVAAVADPATGYSVYVDGSATVIGGTSAVAPLWAALVCRIAQKTGKRVGYANPKLYAGVSPGVTPGGLRDITSGSNGAYSAGPGWDACTGLGVPAAGLEGRFSS